MNYFEDISIGDAAACGDCQLTEAEMVAFAERYDPQPIHVDPDAAAESPYGGVIASGWHTAAACMRLLVDGWIDDVETYGGRGVDELRWHRPVRPGDALSVQVEVADKYSASCRDDRGYVDVAVTATNRAGDPVLSWTLLGIVARR